MATHWTTDQYGILLIVALVAFLLGNLTGQTGQGNR